MSRHIIHKQQVTLHIHKQEESHTYQNTVSGLFRNELTDTLETLFDEVAGADKVIRIDTLRLNLGIINARNFEQDFKEQFVREVRNQLQKKKDNSDIKDEVVTVTGKKSARDTLLYFLQFGSLPWFAASKKTGEWESEMLRQFTSSDWQFLAEWLQKNQAVNPAVSQRFVFQFSNTFIAQIFAQVVFEPGESIEVLFKDLQYLLIELVDEKTLEARNKIWLSFFEYFLLKKEKHAFLFIISELFILKLSTAQLSNLPFDVEKINEKLEAKSVSKILDNLTAFIKKEKQKNEERLAEKGKQKDAGIPSEKGNAYFKWFGLHNISPDALAEILSTENVQQIQNKNSYDKSSQLNELLILKEKIKASTVTNLKTKAVTPEETFYISASGIVILHPFLEPYFTELELMNDKKFLNQDLQSRAVLLLDYLATGNVEAAEFDLVLQKIICGVALEETLPAQIELSEKEKDESAKLLQSITDYWPPLKNTSAEGLRSSFLQRDGKLTLTDNGWKLIAEQKTIDILLAKLPWGFSTIRLPWMKEIISVEWC